MILKQILLDRGTDINHKDFNGWTALMFTAKYTSSRSSIDTVKLLLEYRADHVS